MAVPIGSVPTPAALPPMDAGSPVVIPAFAHPKIAGGLSEEPGIWDRAVFEETIYGHRPFCLGHRHRKSCS